MNTTEKTQDIIEQKYVIMITDTIESACGLKKCRAIGLPQNFEINILKICLVFFTFRFISDLMAKILLIMY